MALPPDQYLLTPADEKILEAFLANEAKPGGHDWKQVCDVTDRLTELLYAEGIANAKSRGIPYDV